METEKLERKLARALKKGDEARAAELRQRLAQLAPPPPPPPPPAAEEDPLAERLAKLRRKIARAEARGDAERAEALRLKAAGLAGGDAAHDDAAEAGLRRAHGAGAGGASSSASSAPPPAAPAAGATEVPEGMVLGKNGKLYPKPPPLPPGNTTILLFYAYVTPRWSPAARAAAIEHTSSVLTAQGCTGRLRVALEGFNGTLTGPHGGIRAFCQALRDYAPEHFGATDFKFVDGLQDGKRFRTLKVWPVEELVTYGFAPEQAPLAAGGKHVKPAEWTALAARGDTVMIDVRNANESAIGRFAPPPGGAVLLDPRMRRSTEFADWCDRALPQLEGKTVMMYCTGGVRWCVRSRGPAYLQLFSSPLSTAPCPLCTLASPPPPRLAQRARLCAAGREGRAAGLDSAAGGRHPPLPGGLPRRRRHLGGQELHL